MIEEQTNDLLGGHLVELQFVPVQQQTNDSDCGVFATAFAVSLALGTNPKHVTFNTLRMHPHLAACLKAEKNKHVSCFLTYCQLYSLTQTIE